MRHRSADCVLETIRENYRNGIIHYFFTDDNFSRNPEWEKVFDGLIHMIEVEGMDISFMMQVDTRSHTIRNFVEKAGRAGCTQVFIGMESLNPKNLDAVRKKQNKVDDYAALVEAWHKVGVMAHVGYIIGFPFDTPESVREDIRKLKDEVRVDQASFFMLTPLPGSIDHFTMTNRGDYLDPDLNRYDSFHVSMKHPLMTDEEWVGAYNEAWETFYRFDNLKNVLIRAGRKQYWNIFKNIMWYKNSLLEPRHPMVAGFVRRKHRTDVRPGTPVMGRITFAMMRIREMVGGFRKRITLFFELQELWLLTRKPDDLTFKRVTDFTSYLSELKNRILKVNTHEELEALVTSQKKKTHDYYSVVVGTDYNLSLLRGRSKKRFEALITDMNLFLDKIISEHHAWNFSHFAMYLNKMTKQAEEFSLKQVALRRRITQFWFLTWERIRKGKILIFIISIPKIIVSAIRDFRMSLSFTYHFKNRTF